MCAQRSSAQPHTLARLPQRNGLGGRNRLIISKRMAKGRHYRAACRPGRLRRSVTGSAEGLFGERELQLGEQQLLVGIGPGIARQDQNPRLGPGLRSRLRACLRLRRPLQWLRRALRLCPACRNPLTRHRSPRRPRSLPRCRRPSKPVALQRPRQIVPPPVGAAGRKSEEATRLGRAAFFVSGPMRLCVGFSAMR